MIYYGLVALQHRGQESAGMAVTSGKGMTIRKRLGLVSHVFPDDQTLNELKGAMGIGHVRYSTTGSTTERNAQPLLGLATGLGMKTHVQHQLKFEETPDAPIERASYYENGAIALAHNGNLINASELRDMLVGHDYQFETTTDSEVIVHLTHHHLKQDHRDWTDGENLLHAVCAALRDVEGAYALLLMTPRHLIAASDPHGIRPLVMGTLAEGGHVFASETCGLDIVGAKLYKEIPPGEVELIDISGRPPQSKRFKPGKTPRRALCVFEKVYFARPDSEFGNMSIEDARERMGRVLAIEHPADVDFVVPIPDSGSAAAIGYAEQLEKRCVPALIKNRYVLRTFIQPDARLREQGIKLKLNPLRQRVVGKRIAIVDDSIVRGTTTRQIVRLLKEVGASEVHVRVSCPPIKYPCYYGIDTSCRDDLIAAKMDKEEIRRYIGADSLEFLSLEGLHKAVGSDSLSNLSVEDLRKPAGKDGHCYACIDGDYPAGHPVKIMRKLAFEKDQVT